MVLRLSFFLLVFANLAFFAWVQGYFGATDANREPERLQQQLQPEKLRLVAAPGGAKAVAEATACRGIGGLSMVNAEALKATALAAGNDAQLVPVLEPKAHLVLIAELANLVAAEKKAAELRRLGVTQQEIVATDGERREIVLGRFTADAAARDFLAELVKRGVKSARVEGRDQPPQKARVELRGPADRLLQQLPALIGPYADAAMTECSR